MRWRSGDDDPLRRRRLESLGRPRPERTHARGRRRQVEPVLGDVGTARRREEEADAAERRRLVLVGEFREILRFYCVQYGKARSHVFVQGSRLHRPMSATSRNEEEMIAKTRQKLPKVTDPVEKLRLLCLQRGSSGILAFGKVFRRMDDDGSRSLSFEEFCQGLGDTGLHLTYEEAQDVFRQFDREGSGCISFDEFLISVRPPMNASRRKLVAMAFHKMDATGDGVIALEDLRRTYNVRSDPKYISGEDTADVVLHKIITKFEKNGSVDGKVTRDEFFDYYSGVSASIDNDAYFDLMMRTAYKL
ncbi:unnamed protein product [Darwinula stevensoni]|uniref:EF-hand domain-containing protein n=1 Tax=Darwinula stevensoni TaxID=69355 RepID=A0A7R8ZZG0_9CRUS|nr:unnamed protein product [Darwinula stevensoni]CAG0883621.1 unnamed protein product [Darwinula stevensoni]